MNKPWEDITGETDESVNCFYDPCCYGPVTLSHAANIKYLKLGFLKVPKAVTTNQLVVATVVVSQISR